VRDAGLAHLLAISGLHVGLVTGLIFLVVRALLALAEPLALRWPIKKWAAAVALLGAFGYLLLAGATVPTQRAFLMTGLILLAVMLDRVAITLSLVAWAAFVVLLTAPESLLGPSFQMSFAAVVALVSVYEAARGPLGRWRTQAPWPRRLLLYAVGVALTTVVAAGATSPFVAYHFNRLATYGLAANLLAVPLTALWIMPCGVLALLLMPLGLEALALQPMGWGIARLIAIAETAAGWPGAVRTVGAMPESALVAIALGGLWLCLWSRPWRWLGLAGIAGGLFAAALAQPPDALVSENGKLLAVRDAEGALLLSSKRAEKFTAGIWLRRNGGGAPQPWPESGAASADGRLACDALGCVLHAEGHVVALVQDGRALAEDCRRATLVVATVPVRRACGAAVIDRFDLWRDGAHAVWLTPHGVRTLSVDAWRGERPWVPRR
jgi:competence protein ComEC